MKTLSKAQKAKFISNLRKFTFPLLALFFGALAVGKDVRVALGILLYAFYAALQDFFSKAK